MQLVVMKAAPQEPSCRPNSPAKQAPIKDRKTNDKYIFSRKGGIRTHDTSFPYKDLADLRYKPLSHISCIIIPNGVRTHATAVKEQSPNL